MNRCRKLKTASILLALLFTLPVLAITGQYKVVRVVDGYTIVIKQVFGVRSSFLTLDSFSAQCEE